MKFKGKVAAWFWLIIIAVNAVCIYELLFDPDNVPILLFSLALCDIIFIPIVVLEIWIRFTVIGFRSCFFC